MEIRLSRPTAFPTEMFEPLKEGFTQLFRPRTLYRSTGVVLAGLVPEKEVQYTLFDDVARIEKMARLYTVVDVLSERFGKHTVQHGASLTAKLQAQHEGERGDTARRKTDLFRGRTSVSGWGCRCCG